MVTVIHFIIRLNPKYIVHNYVYLQNSLWFLNSLSGVLLQFKTQPCKGHWQWRSRCNLQQRRSSVIVCKTFMSKWWKKGINHKNWKSNKCRFFMFYLFCIFLQISGAAKDEFATTNQVSSLVSFECCNLNSIYFPWLFHATSLLQQKSDVFALWYFL